MAIKFTDKQDSEADAAKKATASKREPSAAAQAEPPPAVTLPKPATKARGRKKAAG